MRGTRTAVCVASLMLWAATALMAQVTVTLTLDGQDNVTVNPGATIKGEVALNPPPASLTEVTVILPARKGQVTPITRGGSGDSFIVTVQPGAPAAPFTLNVDPKTPDGTYKVQAQRDPKATVPEASSEVNVTTPPITLTLNGKDNVIAKPGDTIKGEVALNPPPTSPTRVTITIATGAPITNAGSAAPFTVTVPANAGPGRFDLVVAAPASPGTYSVTAQTVPPAGPEGVAHVDIREKSEGDGQKKDDEGSQTVVGGKVALGTGGAGGSLVFGRQFFLSRTEVVTFNVNLGDQSLVKSEGDTLGKHMLSPTTSGGGLNLRYGNMIRSKGGASTRWGYFVRGGAALSSWEGTVIPEGGTATARALNGQVAYGTLGIQWLATDTKNTGNFGWDLGLTTRVLMGNVGQDELFRRQVIGNPRTVYWGVEGTVFSRFDGDMPWFLRISNFQYRDRVPGFSGWQLILGADLLAGTEQAKPAAGVGSGEPEGRTPARGQLPL